MTKGVYKRTKNKGWFKKGSIANPNNVVNLTHRWVKGVKIRLGIKHSKKTKAKISV